ncbi:hypothetical protein F5Y12DRAFT_259050 [Xylaria sp. FL1777]|nr:hypothetical protein F5Y12DRAFT_259050 [Xylaria sp. FL1777]
MEVGGIVHLFRRRFGARNETPTTDTERVDSNPPPSYEDSQDASLREVLQGARAVLSVLWPSTCTSESPSRSTSPTSLTASLPKPAVGTCEKGQNTEGTNPIPSAHQEDAIIQVLANLAMAPCGGDPFLDRIRQFSDFYFTPYTASEGNSTVPSQENGTSSGEKTQGGTVVPRQEQQRQTLQTLNAPRESAALVLCARVLEEYYAGLRHVDSTADVDIDIPMGPSKLDSEGEKSISPSGKASEAKGGGEELPPPPASSLPRIKTRLTQIAACVVEDCTCCDFDEGIPRRAAETVPKPYSAAVVHTGVSQRCGCGHPRTSHHSSSEVSGISRLMRRYTNWDSASYAALGHRSADGRQKRRVVEVRACGARARAREETSCPCRDYDKGRRTGRCARCGHYDGDHFAVDVARGRRRQQQQQEEEDKRRRKRGSSAGRSNTTTGTEPAQKNAEWELSWILIENAYLLLHQIAPLSGDENC